MGLGLRYKNEEQIFQEQYTEPPYLEYPMFRETGIVKHGFSTRIGGVSKGCFSSLNLSFHSHLSDLSYGSSPSGMTQSDHFLYRIHKIQRNAVRIKCYQTNSRNVSHQTIYIRVGPRFYDPAAFVCFCHYPHIGRMCLVSKHHILTSDSHR